MTHENEGHLCVERLEIMKKQYPFANTCHLIKQRKLPFANSKSRTTCKFDLIHVDI